MSDKKWCLFCTSESGEKAGVGAHFLGSDMSNVIAAGKNSSFEYFLKGAAFFPSKQRAEKHLEFLSIRDISGFRHMLYENLEAKEIDDLELNVSYDNNQWVLCRDYGNRAPLYAVLADGSRQNIKHAILGIPDLMCFRTEMEAYVYRNERMMTPPCEEDCVDHLVASMRAVTKGFLLHSMKHGEE